MESFIQQALQAGSMSAALIAAVFTTGVLTSLTPCVYPLLPVTVSIVGRCTSTPSNSFFFALLYVLGLSLTYAGLGALAAIGGQLFGSVASHPVTRIFFALTCLFMAAWMSGLIRMPQFAAPVNTHSSRFRGLTVFAAGAASGLVMAPCTSPVLGMLLMFIAASQKVLWGAVLMFLFAFGMSTLLILAGSFSGLLSNLPRSGAWLNFSKYLLAALMVLASIYFFYLSISSF